MLQSVNTQISAEARRRLCSARFDPIFFSAWKRTVFIHFEVDPDVLQAEVPFELDLRDGRAYVSLVAFHMEKMRPRFGGKLGALCVAPVATHEFLNIRTYVREGNESGIYFLAEYLPNRISLLLGPALYGLPYRHGKLTYEHFPEQTGIHGHVTDGVKTLSYEGPKCELNHSQCEAGTLDEFLLERYTAFTYRNGTKRFFRIWHPPWPKQDVAIDLRETTLLSTSGRWFSSSRLIGAHYSPGFENVWMGRPRS